MTEELFSMRTFDPRRHNAVAIYVSDRQASQAAVRLTDAPMKSFIVGPNVPAASLSLRRPQTAPNKPLPRKLPDGTIDPHPRFLSRHGQWVAGELPSLVTESQSQPLTATHTLEASLPGGPPGPSRTVAPVTAVHSYADVSPVATAEMVHDADDEHHTLQGSRTTVRPTTAPPLASRTMRTREGLFAERRPKTTANFLDTGRGPAAYDTPTSRAESISAFWSRRSEQGHNLQIKDLERLHDFGKNVVPGSPNCRLIGSSWRYLERPVEGDRVYTDYYGRCGTDPSNYYGRAINMNLKNFDQNRLVDDRDYVKLQAGMPGIRSLRARPGLSLNTSILNGPSDRLSSMSIQHAHTAQGLHRHHDFARLRPSSTSRMRGSV